MTITIDSNSGFCFGVVYAIQRAEEELSNLETLYCLGDIVHNNVEVERLRKKGLKTIDHEQLKGLHDCKVLIRAHGEPPETYRIALENNIKLLDASCPVVLRLQNNIKTGFDAINKIEGQVVIYGKKGHAEVNGLLGQTQGNGIVISDFSDLDSIDFSKPINIFSQTTKSLEGYEKITEEIKCRMKAATGKEDIQFIANKTICSQVSKRDVELKTFSLSHEVIIFVSGIKSSNGKVLFDVCRKQNPSSYFVSDSDDLNPAWFAGIETVGICGATSTPRWLMEKIHDEIFKLIEK